MPVDEYDAILGQNLKNARERRGLSVQYVADHMDFCKDTVYKYEAGKREMLVKTLVRASVMLNANYETLLAGLKMDGSEQYAGKEFNVLAPETSKLLMNLATNWDGNIDALMVFAAMVAAWPEEVRRELYMQATITTDQLIADGIISPADLPPGMDFMQSEIGNLYGKGCSR